LQASEYKANGILNSYDIIPVHDRPIVNH